MSYARRHSTNVCPGNRVRYMATVHWHLKQIYQKLPISRQVDLVRLVLSIAEFG